MSKRKEVKMRNMKCCRCSDSEDVCKYLRKTRISPMSGRKLKRDGRAYKALDKFCVDEGLPKGHHKRPSFSSLVRREEKRLRDQEKLEMELAAQAAAVNVIPHPPLTLRRKHPIKFMSVE